MSSILTRGNIFRSLLSITMQGYAFLYLVTTPMTIWYEIKWVLCNLHAAWKYYITPNSPYLMTMLRTLGLSVQYLSFGQQLAHKTTYYFTIYAQVYLLHNTSTRKKEVHVCTAGVVVSCKIPILATRVRFPGSARFFFIVISHDFTLPDTIRNFFQIIASLNLPWEAPFH